MAEFNVKAINTFGNQTADNHQGFVVQSQQTQSNTKLTKQNLVDQLNLNTNRMFKSDRIY